MATILALSDIYRGSDTDCRIVLNRPAQATYDMTTSEVSVSFKRMPGLRQSVFEASTTPTNFFDTNDIEIQQGTILASKNVDEITGEFIIPRDFISKNIFRLARTILFYTVWIVVDGRRIVVEDGKTFVNATCEFI